MRSEDEDDADGSESDVESDGNTTVLSFFSIPSTGTKRKREVSPESGASPAIATRNDGDSQRNLKTQTGDAPLHVIGQATDPKAQDEEENEKKQGLDCLDGESYSPDTDQETNYDDRIYSEENGGSYWQPYYTRWVEQPDLHLQCRACNEPFLFTKQEQKFFAERGYDSQPQRCVHCRKDRRRDKSTGEERRCRSCGSSFLYSNEERTRLEARGYSEGPTHCGDCRTKRHLRGEL